ncbi:MAG: cupin domain-containing protein [Gammaproteobacteria bacterium]|nr:cupin domain-containing protein [Gammaproteobacteria bacterium]
MPIDPGPHDLNKILYILGPDGSATLKADSPDFYQELNTEFNGFAGHTLISRFSFDEPWSTWEMHPMGDEFLYLLEGDTDLVLMQDGKEETVRVHIPGDYVVVPQGVWHTARPCGPTTMLLITPGEGTLNEKQPPAI